MPLRQALAAILRSVRSTRGLNQDEFKDAVTAKHLHLLENGKHSVTLDTLEEISEVLQTDPLTLLILASAIEKNLTRAVLLADLNEQLEGLEALGVMETIKAHYQDGKLIPGKAGKSTSTERLNAIRECKTAGMTQKATSLALGIPQSTVHDLWKRVDKI